jgi:hypothetical protein
MEAKDFAGATHHLTLVLKKSSYEEDGERHMCAS